MASLASRILHRRPKNEDVTAEEEEILLDLPVNDNSPYPEVRVAVPNFDDPTLPQNTLRMWILGFLFLSLSTVVNTLFSLHDPPFLLSTILCSVVCWPLGRLWDRIVPNKTILGIPLNPGPFNVKEHALLTIMISSVTTTYGADISLTLSQFYQWPGYTTGFQILLTLSTQCIGLSMAGFFRQILVYPSAMIWPTNLVSVTFLNNIHRKWNHVADGWKITRFKFFFIAAGCTMVYSLIPGYFAPFLSDFDFPAWISPNDPMANTLFGTISGLGVFPITFDWNVISGWLSSPLIPPMRVFINEAVGIILFMWLVAGSIHLSNTWFSQYMPIVSNDTYDRYQKPYDVDKILDGGKFNQDSYYNYSPLYMSATTAVSYGLSIAGATATVTHSLLFDSHRYITYWRESSQRNDDVHMRLMRKYREAPYWWYGVVFIVCFVLMVVSVRIVPGNVEVGILILALVLSFVFVVPVSFIYAVSTIAIGTNVVAEMIAGYMRPGNPLTMMLFKTYSYYTMLTAVGALGNMKLAHYMKLAPRTLFFVQLVGIGWGGFLQILIVQALRTRIPNLCSENQSFNYSCPSIRTFYNSSVIWGVIGPKHIFALYKPLLHFAWIGALCPVLNWIWLNKYPRSMLRVVHYPVLFESTGFLPPATPYAYGCWILVGFIFSYWIRRYWFNWWAKYNYTLSCGLDLGLAASQVLIFIINMCHQQGPPQWWGTTGCYDTRDGRRTPLRLVKPGGFFGPSSWK